MSQQSTDGHKSTINGRLAGVQHMLGGFKHLVGRMSLADMFLAHCECRHGTTSSAKALLIQGL